MQCLVPTEGTPCVFRHWIPAGLCHERRLAALASWCEACIAAATTAVSLTREEVAIDVLTADITLADTHVATALVSMRALKIISISVRALNRFLFISTLAQLSTGTETEFTPEFEQWWNTAIQDVGNAFEDVGEDIENAFEDVGEAIEEVVEDVGEAIEEVVEDVGEAVEQAWWDTNEAISGVIEDVGEWVVEAAEDINEWVDEQDHLNPLSMLGITDIIGFGADVASYMATDFGDDFENAIDDIVEDVGDWVEGAVEDTGEFFEDVGDWVEGAVEDTGEFFEDVFNPEFWYSDNYITDWYSDGIDAIEDWAEDAGSWIETAFDDAGNWL